MAERQAISKRLRFEVLKRDAFTCQYCGKQPPDTVLHLDHIKPVSKGGKNTLLNLVTSCQECNLGKSNKELSDDSAIKKQQKQLSDMAEKKAQIEMMIDWRESLINSDKLLSSSVKNIIDDYMDGYSVSETGLLNIEKAIKKSGYQKVVDAVEKCFMYSKDSEDFRLKWSDAIRFAGSQKTTQSSISYAKGILKNRGVRISEKAFYAEFNCAITLEQSDQIVEAAKRCNSMEDFRKAYAEVLNG